MYIQTKDTKIEHPFVIKFEDQEDRYRFIDGLVRLPFTSALAMGVFPIGSSEEYIKQFWDEYYLNHSK